MGTIAGILTVVGIILATVIGVFVIVKVIAYAVLSTIRDFKSAEGDQQNEQT